MSDEVDVLVELLTHVSTDVVPHRKAFEATNMLTIALAVVKSALHRSESRGCHRRSDYPSTDAKWQRHSCVVLDHGQIRVTS